MLTISISSRLFLYHQYQSATKNVLTLVANNEPVIIPCYAALISSSSHIAGSVCVFPECGLSTSLLY